MWSDLTLSHLTIPFPPVCQVVDLRLTMRALSQQVEEGLRTHEFQSTILSNSTALIISEVKEQFAAEKEASRVAIGEYILLHDLSIVYCSI